MFIHIGIPEQIYYDEEGGFNSKDWIQIMNEDGIKHIQTLTHAPTVERFISTINDFLHRRLDVGRSEVSLRRTGKTEDRSQWTTHINAIVGKYNDTVHTTTKIKPTEATQQGNFLWTAWHLADHARKEK
eukprot:11776551-Heterocapsa_arctica.AAC.1